MLSNKWKTIIDALSVINPESVNKEKIDLMLSYDMEVNSQVIDNLYMLGLLSLDDYKKRMSKYIEHLKESILFAEKELETAIEKDDEYDPIIFYAFKFPSKGTEIENKLNQNFFNK